MHKFFQGLSVLVAIIGLSACFGSRSAAPDYHMLTARAANSGATLDTTIGVGPVRVAPFLMRPSMVTHAGGSSMQVAQDERWGEPLEQGVQRTLQQNIAALTGATTRNFPWRQSATPAYAVRVEIQDMDRLADGTAVIVATWLLEDLRQGKLLRSQDERITTAVGGDYGALANAYSELVAQLAQRIAAALNDSARTVPAS